MIVVMSTGTFRIAFEGEPFASGEIDVNDLAPSLLALGDLIQSANSALNGKRAKATLKVRATNSSCFEAFLSIDVSMVAAAIDMLDMIAESEDRLIAADRLLELLIKGGTIVGAPLLGLIAVVRWLKGRRPDSVARRDDGTVSITINHTTIITESQTVKLLEDIPTRQALENFAEKSLRIPGVEAVKLGEKNSDHEVNLVPSDRAALQVPEPSEEPPIIERIEREVWLKIITSHFRDGYKWRFSDGGDKPFTADMADQKFLQSALGGKLALSANDALKCKLIEEQRLTSSGLTKETTIIEVVDYRPGAKQLRLL